ncbi:hypothetical protein FV217_22095, partial [Methylobacterium sp. WL9]
MTRHAYLAAALLTALTAGPVLASPCSEQIEALSGKVHEEGRQAIAAGTGYGWTLGEALVSEGLAGRFVSHLFGTPP